MKKKSASATGAAVSPSPVSPVQSPPENSESEQEEIARLAHSFWEARGCQGGSPEEDWYKAEGELKALLAAAGK